MLSEIYREAVNQDVVEKSLEKNKLPKHGLTDTDKNAIEIFSNCNDLVITKARKGGAAVTLVVKYYIAKTNEQPQDSSFYDRLNVDPNVKSFGISSSAVENFK